MVEKNGRKLNKGKKKINNGYAKKKYEKRQEEIETIKRRGKRTGVILPAAPAWHLSLL